MKIRSSLLIFLFLGFEVSGQYFSTGQDPASIRWKMIRTDRYRLIFPETFGQRAQYLANILDLVSRNEVTTLSARVPRLPVILHTQSVISNGVTVWAPRRIEMYTCPPQQTYPEEWLEQLAVHEYRHAIQISKINRGFSKALGYIFGEQITGGILGLYVPSWFLEGDATVTETALTRTGRGRSGLFESTLKAQVVEKGIYSYDKATMGSYRTFVPDAYSLGYFLVGQARKKYGPDLWNTAVDRVAKYPFMVVPFNSGIRKVTGKWKTQLYRESLLALDSAWRKQLAASAHRPMRYINRPDPVNHPVYNHPLWLNDSTIVADKSSIDDVSRFVLIDRRTGMERILLTPGYYVEGSISTGGRYIAWSEFKRDPRWSNRDHSGIRICDHRTGKQQRLARTTRYFSPALSYDGSGLAAVYQSMGNECFIDILEVPSGRIVKRFPVPGSGQAIYPNWSPDAKKILFTIVCEKGATIATLDTASGNIRYLLPFTFTEITGRASFLSHYLIYNTNCTGTENVWAMDTLTHAIFRVSSGRFATYDPSFTSDGKYMACSDYNSEGLMIAGMQVDTADWVPMSRITDDAYKLYDALSAQESANIQDSVLIRRLFRMNSSGNVDIMKDSIDGILYPVKKYRKILNLFNPHSWAPVSFDITNLTFSPGVMVLSQNALSTMFAGAGWEYDLNERTGKFYTTLSYRGWYPALDLRFTAGNRASYAQYQKTGEIFRFTWQETTFTALIGIPWNFLHGRYSRSLHPSAGTTLISVVHNSTTPENFTSGLIRTMDYRLSASQFQLSGQKDLYPRIGQSIDLTYRNCPFGGNDMGSIFAVDMSLYFPGIIRHHGIFIYAGYQHRDGEDLSSYSFSNLIAYPRGYSGAYDEDLLTLRLNYAFPIWYPDLSLGSVIYLKRLKMNLYYDWANGKNPGYINEYQSTGAELTFDFHLLRFISPIEFGVRSIYYPTVGHWGAEILYSISY